MNFLRGIQAMFALFARVLLSEKGEVPETTPDSGETPPADDQPLGDMGSPEDGEQVPEGGGEAPPKVESFFDPSKLDPVLKAQWSNMHRAYTKEKEKVRGVLSQAQMVERFNNDPEFARQTIQAKAAQLGYQLVPVGQNGSEAVTQPGQQNGMLAAVQQALKASTPPELHWMVDSQAQGLVAALSQALTPIQQKLTEYETREQKNRQQSASQQYQEATSKLAERHPGWEEHEDDMLKILEWWQSPNLTHPLYGSKLDLLYDVATKQASAVSEAARRLSAAAKNRSSSSHVTSRSGPNIAEQVRKAPNSKSAWEIAAKAALAQHGG